MSFHITYNISTVHFKRIAEIAKNEPNFKSFSQNHHHYYHYMLFQVSQTEDKRGHGVPLEQKQSRVTSDRLHYSMILVITEFLMAHI